MGISGSNDFGEQCQSRIAHFVFFHNGVERYVLAMMPKLAVGHIVHDPVRDLSPIRLVGKKDELSFWVDKLF